MQSDLWRRNNEWFDTTAKIDWDKFKHSDFFYKIALWNPSANGVRYLKMLLYNLGMGLSEYHLNVLNKIPNRNIGNPYSVMVNGCEFDFDYLNSAYEISTIKDYLDLSEKRILELGAGYGRTCHSIISNFDIDEYVIVDLDTMLQISRQYLHKVLPSNQYKKIHFVSADNISSLSGDFDLAIQIDGFNEMDREVVFKYLDIISETCNYFYTKNPVGKYLDASLDNHWEGKVFVDSALSAGVITDIIDIHNDTENKSQIDRFVDIFCPNRVYGQNWNCLHSSWAPPISFMAEAFYCRGF